MSYQVTVTSSGTRFSCDEDETILSAAIRLGIGLPYGCKSGACGSCKGRLVSGEITHEAYQERALSLAEAEAGMTLFCRARPVSDVSIDVREVAGSSDYPVRKLPVRISALDRPAPDVMILTLQLPATDRFRYRPGQYIEVILRDGKRRSYSMASQPEQDSLVLHIRHIPGGLFTDQVFSTLKVRDIMRLEGPLGTFFLREDSNKPMILLATGTGFAPLQAIVERAASAQPGRNMTLYWGGRQEQDLYMAGLCREWEQTIPGFRFVPVLSQAGTAQTATAKKYVQDAVLADFPDLSGHQVYACGSPAMVASAQTVLTGQAGLPEEDYFADAFTTAADNAE